jgi:N,N-dimethylformamidase
MRSGIYAAKLTTRDGEDYVPFFVRPRKGKQTSKTLFIVPTLSYLAYANEQNLNNPEMRKALNIPETDYPKQPQDVYLVENRLLSLYDHHTDGSGVCYTSRLRPILNMRPKYVMQALSSGQGAPHQFNADLHLTDWLEEKGFDFDVITDEDLHHEGLSVLRPYRVVLTGSHHEYWTTPMLDALEAYLNGGGRMMYLGGNGFYWVTTVNPENPWIFEVRRWWGTGAWMADPGEYHNSFTGEPGGVWRNRGRHPQKLVGVGFSAQGFDMNKPYKRQPGSFDKSVAFMFEGIGEDELIGDFPSLVLNSGAAGFELDRVDYKLGSPSHTLILGTATGFTDNYQHVIEEVNLMDNKQGGTTHPLVKADLAYVRYPNGGGVFSTGSISWCGSLSYNNYDNNVSKLMTNVLKKFASDQPLP